jgi:hypothetical protein
MYIHSLPIGSDIWKATPEIRFQVLPEVLPKVEVKEAVRLKNWKDTKTLSGRTNTTEWLKHNRKMYIYIYIHILNGVFSVL